MRYALASALADSQLYVRIGAALAAPNLSPDGCETLLNDRLRTLDPRVDSTEGAAIAVALAHGRGDSAPAAAFVLGDTTAEVQALLEGPQDDWAQHLTAKVKQGVLPARSARLLTSLFGAVRLPGLWYWRPQTAADRANRALSELRSWQSMITSWGRNTELEDAANAALKRPIELLHALDTGAAARALIDIGITAPGPWIRILAGKGLAALELDASLPLIELMGGGGGPRPNAATLASIQDEARVAAPLAVNDVEDLTAFLAADILKNFSDQSTSLALTNVALTAPPALARRTAAVLADMDAASALPSLVWAERLRPSAAERAGARTLLGGLLRGEGDGRFLAKIGSAQVSPSALGWLAGLAERPTSASPWLDSQPMAWRIMHNAIEVMPDLIQTQSAQFSVAPTLDRFVSFQAATAIPSGKMELLPATQIDRLPRHPKVSFSASCQVGQSVDFSVRLLPLAADGTLPPFDVPFVPGADSTDLIVMIYSPAFDIAPEVFAVLRVPREGPSDDVVFHLTPRLPGEQAIDVKFLAGTQVVGHCVVVVTVSGEGESTMVLDPVDHDAVADPGGARLRLRVTRTDNDRLDYLQILPTQPLPRRLGRSPGSFPPDQVRDWAAQFSNLIKTFQAYDLSSDDLQGVLAQLAALGSSLLEQLLPPELTASVAALPAGSLIAIETDADWVPWELLACDVTERLWGERFTVTRTPLISAPPGDVAPVDTIEPLERALLVVGDNIKSKPDALPGLTFGAMSGRTQSLVQGTWPQLSAQVKTADIVHFACHGGGWPNSLSYGAGAARKLVPKQSKALGLRRGTIVFANACESATADLMLAGFESFGREFFLAGARPFIGTLGPVPEQEAIGFARLFYEAFAVRGLTAGQSMSFAKETARTQFKVPIWLFYCLYGNESASRRWRVGA